MHTRQISTIIRFTLAVIIASELTAPLGLQASNSEKKEGVCRIYLRSAPKKIAKKKKAESRAGEVKGESVAERSGGTPLAEAKESAAKIAGDGVTFQPENTREGDYETAEIKSCTRERYKKLDDDFKKAFGPKEGEETPIQYLVERLPEDMAKPKREIKDRSRVTDLRARVIAKALESQCQQKGSSCDFSSAPLEKLEQEVQSRCAEGGNSGACRELKDALNNPNPAATGFEISGSPLSAFTERFGGARAGANEPPSPIDSSHESLSERAQRLQNIAESLARTYGRHPLATLDHSTSDWSGWGGYAHSLIHRFAGAAPHYASAFIKRLFQFFSAPFKRAIQIISGFGDSRGDHAHEGVDIACKYGEAVLASADGIVEPRLGNDKGMGGIRVWLDHGMVEGGDSSRHHIETYYAHLSGTATTTRRGAPVKQGEVIGYCGNSGNARGRETHLHYECHVDGSPVDPQSGCVPSA